MEYENCSTCGSAEQVTLLNHEGNCVPCEQVLAADDELPQVAVVKLAQMAESRHPTTCNEDAPRFRAVLEENGFL